MLGQQFPYSAYLRHGSRGKRFRALGELARYREVGKLQKLLNAVKAFYTDWTPGPDIGEDEKYGRSTNGRLRSFIRFVTRASPVIESCAGTGTDELNRSGPAGVANCLYGGLVIAPYAPLDMNDMDIIQQAWGEWKLAGSTAENDRPVVTNPPGADGTPVPPTTTPPGTEKEEGMSTGAWVLLFVLGAAAVVGTWWVVSD